MPDVFADDLFEIFGTHIQITKIKDYRLGQIEYIMRPVYCERGQAKWKKMLGGFNNHRIRFGGMEPYGAIIGETNYKNAIEEAPVHNVFEAAFKAAANNVENAVSGLMKKPAGRRIRYRIMNASWRVFERTLDDIPAALYREDGKASDVYPKDELYPLLGEPVAPAIEEVPALFITSLDGNYVFFGNGIQVMDIQQEYERLKLAIQAVKEIKAQKGKKGGLLQNAFDIKLPQAPKINIPFLTPGEKPKALDRPGEDPGKVNKL